MKAEPTDKSIIKFISLDINRKRKAENNTINNRMKNIYERLFENEWFQEYELIYSLQETEDWNLEEPDDS